MYEAGWMDRENEILQLAQLYMLNHGAYKGARLIEKGISDGVIERNERNYRLLAQAWVQAQDDRRSIPPLREAAQRAAGGELYVQLAQSHLNLYDYEECVSAARTGISRGELRQPGSANVVLGTCLVELQRYDQAREAFRAARADSRSRVSAERWLEFIEREVARNRDLERQLARVQSD
jgi:tetratricopeptide (TPR) repeat protein